MILIFILNFFRDHWFLEGAGYVIIPFIVRFYSRNYIFVLFSKDITTIPDFFSYYSNNLFTENKTKLPMYLTMH